MLFIDEIHRPAPVIEENLYTAIEDFRIDIVQGDGPYAATLQLPLAPFTLVGATTRTGLLTSPLLSRFGIVARLDYYPAEELAQVVARSARLLEIAIDDDAAFEIARRARGTPRIANRLLRRARDFAEVLGDGTHRPQGRGRARSTGWTSTTPGLDEMDRRFLRVIIEHYKGGPVGIETLAAALSEPRDTLEDVYEPYPVAARLPGAHRARPRGDRSRLRAPGPAAGDPRSAAAVLTRKRGETKRQGAEDAEDAKLRNNSFLAVRRLSASWRSPTPEVARSSAARTPCRFRPGGLRGRQRQGRRFTARSRRRRRAWRRRSW